MAGVVSLLTRLVLKATVVTAHTLSHSSGSYAVCETGAVGAVPPPLFQDIKGVLLSTTNAVVHLAILVGSLVPALINAFFAVLPLLSDNARPFLLHLLAMLIMDEVLLIVREVFVVVGGGCRAACGLCASECPEGASSGHSTRSIRPTPHAAATAHCECLTFDGCHCLACLDDALASLAILLRDIDDEAFRKESSAAANAAARGLARDSGHSLPPPRPVNSSKWALIRYVAPDKFILSAISALFPACDPICSPIKPKRVLPVELPLVHPRQLFPRPSAERDLWQAVTAAMSILIPLDVLLPEPIAPVDSSKWAVIRYVTPPDVLSTAKDTPAVAAAAIAPAAAATAAVTVDAPLQAVRMYKPQSHASLIRNLVDRLVKRIQTTHLQAPTTPFEFANIATNLPDLLSNPPDLLPMAEDTPAVIDPVIALAASTAALTISENAAAATPAVTVVAPLQAVRNSSQQPRVSRERHRMAKLAKLIRINHRQAPTTPFVSFNSANHRQDLLLNPRQH